MRKQRDSYVFGLGTAPYRDYQPYSGGVLRLLTSVAIDGSEVAIQHTLRRVPNSMLILYATSNGVPSWQKTATNWNCANIYVSFKSLYAVSPVQMAVLIV